MTLSAEEIEKRIAKSYEVPNRVLQEIPHPMVSIRTSAYQHAPFIRKCIEGILMQKTNFSFEYIIGEDFSSDGTREIVMEYAKKYPNIIRVITSESNVGQKANGFRCVRALRGKYIALCEGDDYWTDPDKLQLQVDFLEKNSDYSMCCGGYVKHHMLTGIEDTVTYRRPPSDEGFTFGLAGTKDLWITKTLTTLYRREALDVAALKRYRFGRDIHFFYHLLTVGKGYYFSRVFGVYNIHPGGVNSMQQGRVNANAAYNSYKELHQYNKSEYTRYKSIGATLALLNYDLYHKYDANTLQRKALLVKESLRMVKSLKDFKMLLSAFLPRSFKDKVKK